MRAYADLLDNLLSSKGDNFNNLIKSLVDILFCLITSGDSIMDINIEQFILEHVY